MDINVNWAPIAMENWYHRHLKNNINTELQQLTLIELNVDYLY